MDKKKKKKIIIIVGIVIAVLAILKYTDIGEKVFPDKPEVEVKVVEEVKIEVPEVPVVE
jgi:hypothetical protein